MNLILKQSDSRKKSLLFHKMQIGKITTAIIFSILMTPETNKIK